MIRKYREKQCLLAIRDENRCPQTPSLLYQVPLSHSLSQVPPPLTIEKTKDYCNSPPGLVLLRKCAVKVSTEVDDTTRKREEERRAQTQCVLGVPLHLELCRPVVTTRNLSPNNKSCNKARTNSSLTN